MKFSNHVLPKQSNYNSVNISNNNGDALNMSNEGVSSSGASTPNHLSQQNLIKIMKKFKSSNSGNPMNIVNKENANPPNIMIGG